MGSSNSLPNQRIAKIHFEISSLEWYCLEPYLGVKTLGYLKVEKKDWNNPS